MAGEEPRKEPAKQTAPGRKSRRGLHDWLLIALAVVIVALAIANSDDVEIHWLVATWSTPLFVLIMVCVLLGFVLGRVSSSRRARSR